jgi:short-subunit dehydrogenase
MRALITGASSGIGEAYADRLARDGYDLVLVARRRERLEAVAARARAAGVGAEVAVADLTDGAALASLEQRLAGEPFDLLINNAGFGGYKPFVAVDPATVESLIRVHVTAMTRLARAALPGMVARKSGGIVQVASLLTMSAMLPPGRMPYRAVYVGCKAYLLAFTQALAGELADSGVRVQCCLPYIIATEFHTVQGIDLSHLPRMSAPDVVTASLAALARGEVVCIPGLEEAAALERLTEAQLAVMRAGGTPILAPRYRG